MGLQSSGQYVSFGSLNGVDLGRLPSAGGDERKGIWADASLEIPAPAIAALRDRNRFTLRNPGRDFFKVRRFWIEIHLPDGRPCSSDVNTSTYTQPPDWTYAEGTPVPFDEPIALEIRFRLHRP